MPYDSVPENSWQHRNWPQMQQGMYTRLYPYDEYINLKIKLHGSFVNGFIYLLIIGQFIDEFPH